MEPQTSYYPEVKIFTSVSYQTWIAECVASFLAHFSPSPKNHYGKLSDSEGIPMSLRIRENPPSVQIIQSPAGGEKAGIQRIREKLIDEKNDFFIPELVVANEKDLTRECIIVTIQDRSLLNILDNNLLAPAKTAEIIEALRKNYPHFFIVVQRYILGIEAQDGFKVPYKVVTEEDRETLQYLENLPHRLGNG